MKKAFFLCLLVAIAVIGITSCEKAPKGILEGSVYMTKDGSSGFVASDGTTTVKLDMKLTFKSDKDCGINFVYQNGKTFSRYEGTYTVSVVVPIT